MIHEGFHYVECHCFYPLTYQLSQDPDGALLAHVLPGLTDPVPPYRTACPQCLCPYPSRHGDLISFCLSIPDYCVLAPPLPDSPPYYNPKRRHYNPR